VVEVLKVSSKSNPNSVAGALAGVLRQTGAVEVQVVGAGALNQAIKAIAIARGFVAPSNLDLVCIPTFADILIDGQGRTAIRLAVEDRARRKPTEIVAAVADHQPVTESIAHAPAVATTTAAASVTAVVAPTVTLAPTVTVGSAAGLAAEPDVAAVSTAAYQAPASSTALLT
jgi:stage V sporulation protein S